MDYSNIPFYWINRLSALSRREVSKRFAAAGHKISPEEWAILLVLWSRGPQTPGVLSDQTIKDRTTVTRLIDGMVRKGVVARKENPDDRRRSDISLTPMGAGLQSELVPIAMGFTLEATKDVPPEDIETTVRTLRRFSENLTSSQKRRQ